MTGKHESPDDRREREKKEEEQRKQQERQRQEREERRRHEEFVRLVTERIKEIQDRESKKISNFL